MISLKELGLKGVYRSGIGDIYHDFYQKCLCSSVRYDRAVGYFSSETLVVSLRGISNFIRSEGKMRLVIGHPLTEPEFMAIQNGYRLAEIKRSLSDELVNLLDLKNAVNSRLQALTYLIAHDRLEIKFALRRAGMYHEKIGIFHDIQGNKVVFTGSANETPHGMLSNLNAESISVYASWNEEVFESYGKVYEDGFETLWIGQDDNTKTIDISSDIYSAISSTFSAGNFDVAACISQDEIYDSISNHTKPLTPHLPVILNDKPFSIFGHQTAALVAWRSNSYKGILKLATGAGKTITSIYAAVKIYEAKKKAGQGLFLIVSVPYVELAIQWTVALYEFGIHAHHCFDSTKKWHDDLVSDIDYFTHGLKDFCAIVVVNKTMATETFNNLINKVDQSSILFIGDECHNLGSQAINEKLPKAFYRIGLSATPFRSDEDDQDSPFPSDSKDRILSYFSEIVAEYSLADAIHDEVLTPYNYHIVPVRLTSDEQDSYDSISRQITAIIQKKNNLGLSKDDLRMLTQLTGKRSRLLGSAENKLIELDSLIRTFSSENRKHTLVYAGEGKPFDNDADDDTKVITRVSRVLHHNGWKTSQFTSAVSKSARKQVMASFKEGVFDALVAMKVLDEGIDIPMCKNALILASTRNPRQYIQRRGRILRRAENKKYANIYDFVVLPIGDSSASKNLLKAEAERVNDFALLAQNKMEIESIIQESGLNLI